MNTTLETRRPDCLARRRRAHDLFDDLAYAEMAGEAGLAGGTEAATHGAAGLARHAHRGAIGVEHEDGLDEGAACELPEELHRRVIVALPLEHGNEGGRQLVVQPGAQGLRQRRELVGLGELLVEAAPDLLAPVTGLAVEEDAQLALCHVVAGGHRVEASEVVANVVR